MNDFSNTLKQFYSSRYGKPFMLAFVGYCFIALYWQPELTGDELVISRFLWRLISDFDPLRISHFNLSHLPYYFPLKTLCFLGFPAIMGANLAAFFGEQQRPIKQKAVFCWAPFYPHPKSFYPEIVDATVSHFFSVSAIAVAIYFIVGVCVNKFLQSNLNKIHLQMLSAVFISVLAAILMVRNFEYKACRFGIELEREIADWEKVQNEWIFLTHFNPIIAFLLAYLGISIMTQLIPALFKNGKRVVKK